MPYAPIRGFDGSVNEGATPTALLGIEDWSANIAQAITTQGPFLGDAGKLYKVSTSIDIKGTVKASVPVGKDAPQTAIITTLTGASTINLTLQQGVVSTGGYLITIPNALITDVKLGQSPKGGASFDFSFEGSGSFTVA